MRQTTIKRLVIALAILMVITSVFSVNVSADYSRVPAVDNWGERDEICTELSDYAENYYTGNYQFDKLDDLSSSELKTQLKNLMTSTHTYTSTYNDCRDLAKYTDCENSDGRILLIYTSYSATRDQYNGWNREHVWPQSLGGGNTSGGGADLHHIRPSDASVNSSRGNKKYGNAGSNATKKYGSNPATGYLGGTYNSTYFEPLDNVKGDVARICLYVYVRWGSAWGADSITEVFQSVDVLLEWCALDPVDTWEMGRNDAVQSIQGNRNVFIDYPELAWMLFGEDVPDDMTTPSMNAGNSSSGGSGGATTEAKTEEKTEEKTEAKTEGNVDVEAKEVLINAEINGSIPSKLTYITNSDKYPDPDFYTNGGLKMKFVNQGIQTATFAKQSSVKVTFNIKALNENEKSETAGVDALTFYGLNSGGSVVAKATLNSLKVGNNEVVLNGEGIVSVKVVMTDYYSNGSKCCNISVGGLKVESVGAAVEPEETTKPNEEVTTEAENDVTTEVTTEIENDVTTEVTTEIENDVTTDVENDVTTNDEGDSKTEDTTVNNVESEEVTERDETVSQETTADENPSDEPSGSGSGCSSSVSGGFAIISVVIAAAFVTSRKKRED